MSYKSTLIKFAIKQTPKKMVLWLANKKTKEIAELIDFIFDLDDRKLYAQILMAGDEEAIELWIEDFTLVTYDDSYKIVIHQVKSNRPWLDTLLTKFILEREWKVPDKHVQLLSELLAFEESSQNDESEE